MRILSSAAVQYVEILYILLKLSAGVVCCYALGCIYLLHAPAFLSFYKYWPDDGLVRPKLVANR